MSDIETIVKVIRFSRAKDWSTWKELFLAKIGRKDPVVRKVFNLKEEFKMTTEDGLETQEITKNKATMRKAYEELLMSMDYSTSEGKAAFNIVKRAKMSNGEGDARLAFSRLMKRFEPKTSIERGKLLKQFYSSKCKGQEDPEAFVYEMEDLRNRIQEANNGVEIIDDDGFMNQVLNSLPETYDSLTEKLQADIDKKGDDKLTIEDMAEQLALKFSKLRMHQGEAQDHDETALVGFNNQFKKKCYYCGKIGHKGADCRERMKNNKQNGVARPPNRNNKFRCFFCNKPGHKKADCREWKKKQASAMMACDKEVALFQTSKGSPRVAASRHCNSAPFPISRSP